MVFDDAGIMDIGIEQSQSLLTVLPTREIIYDALAETDCRIAAKQNWGPKHDLASRLNSSSVSCVNAVSFSWRWTHLVVFDVTRHVTVRRLS